MKIKVMKVLAISGLCLGLATACQTAKEGFTSEREVDPSETRIIMPKELANLKGFKIKKAEIREAASYRSEQISFTGGFITYDRYFRGGFQATTKSNFKKRITRSLTDISELQEIEARNTSLGFTYFTTFKRDDATCFVMQSDYGNTVNFRSGTGSEGRVYGLYCENTVPSGFKDAVLGWMNKVRLR